MLCCAYLSKGDHAKTEEKDPFAIDAQTHTVVPCSRCKAEVMPTDRVGVAGQVLHRKCFECYLPECTVQLTPSRYASITVDGQMRFYCASPRDAFVFDAYPCGQVSHTTSSCTL